MVWNFICVYIMNRILHGRLEIRNFSSRVEKNIFTCSLRSLVKYFLTLEEKFRISGRPGNILYIPVSFRANDPHSCFFKKCTTDRIRYILVDMRTEYLLACVTYRL